MLCLVQHCGNRYLNENGECVLAPGLGYVVADSPSEQFLSISCEEEEACKDNMAYCNKDKGKCQCYATYEAREDTCVLEAQYRKNATKVSEDIRK